MATNPFMPTDQTNNPLAKYPESAPIQSLDYSSTSYFRAADEQRAVSSQSLANSGVVAPLELFSADSKSMLAPKSPEPDEPETKPGSKNEPPEEPQQKPGSSKEEPPEDKPQGKESGKEPETELEKERSKQPNNPEDDYPSFDPNSPDPLERTFAKILKYLKLQWELEAKNKAKGS